MQVAPLVEITDLAAGQWGLVTTAQAAAVGVSRVQLTRLVDSGVLARVIHGVYATPAVLAAELLSIRATWLTLQPKRTAADRLTDLPNAGVVSHTSAAQLHGLGDLLADEHEFTLPTRYQATRDGLRVHRAQLAPTDVTIVAGLPVTTAPRTVADLLSAGHDLEHVAQVAADAVRRDFTDEPTLAAALTPLAHRYGAADGDELTQRLLRLGGLGPEDLSRQLMRSTSGRELMANLEAVNLSPQATKALQDLATLALDPGFHAAMSALTKKAQEAAAPITTRLARTLSPAVRTITAMLPSAEAIERLADVLNEPETRARLEALHRSLRSDDPEREQLDRDETW